MWKSAVRYCSVLLFSGGIFCIFFIAGMFLASIQRVPTNDRVWEVDVRTLPTVTWIDETHVSITSIRDFRYYYGGSFESAYSNRIIDTTTLTGVSVFYVPYWFQRVPILHVMLSFEFSDGEPLVISAETRRERDEDYSLWRGFFNEYELLYVLATERDVVRRRFMVWGEESVYRYSLIGSAEAHKALLRNALNRVSSQHTHPQFYNTFSRSCITVIADMIRDAYGSGPTLFELSLYPQWFDRYLYYRGLIGGGSFAELKRNSLLPRAALRCEPDSEYSRCIRTGGPTSQVEMPLW